MRIDLTRGAMAIDYELDPGQIIFETLVSPTPGDHDDLWFEVEGELRQGYIFGFIDNGYKLVRFHLKDLPNPTNPDGWIGSVTTIQREGEEAERRTVMFRLRRVGKDHELALTEFEEAGGMSDNPPVYIRVSGFSPQSRPVVLADTRFDRSVLV